MTHPKKQPNEILHMPDRPPHFNVRLAARYRPMLEAIAAHLVATSPMSITQVSVPRTLGYCIEACHKKTVAGDESAK